VGLGFKRPKNEKFKRFEEATYASHRREFEQRLFDASVVVNVDSIFEHEVDKVWVGLHELV